MGFEEIGEDESPVQVFSYANMEIILLQEDLWHMWTSGESEEVDKTTTTEPEG